MLVKFGLDIVGQPMGLEGYRRARAADARVRPAWYYLSGIVPLASARMSLNEFNARARAKVAREAPFDRNVENHWSFTGSASGREQKL